MADRQAIDAERLLLSMKDSLTELQWKGRSTTVVQLRAIHLPTIEWLLDLVETHEKETR